MVKELVTFVVQQLVSRPQDVVVNVIQSNDENLFEIRVSPEDRGRVIGKEGHTIKALRMVIGFVTPKNKKVSLELFR